MAALSKLKIVAFDDEAFTRKSGMDDALLDATGAVVGGPSDLPRAVKHIESVIYSYNGEIHRPNLLELSWGAAKFRGRLTRWNISYLLFRPDGKPLRAKLSLDFVSVA